MDARDVPGAPWDPKDILGTPLGPTATPLGPHGTPLGPPGTWDFLGPLGDPQGPKQTAKTDIAQQVCSARSSRLLCSNLPVGTHRLKASLGPFYT